MNEQFKGQFDRLDLPLHRYSYINIDYIRLMLLFEYVTRRRHAHDTASRTSVVAFICELVGLLYTKL